jgi:competence protein ComEA
MKKHVFSVLIVTFLCITGLLIFLFIKQAIGDQPLLIQPLPSSSQISSFPSGMESEKLNINYASTEELELLPGIGPVLAQRIIAYRDEYGPFTHIEDIMNVEGIGKKRFEDIYDLIAIGG